MKMLDTVDTQDEKTVNISSIDLLCLPTSHYCFISEGPEPDAQTIHLAWSRTFSSSACSWPQQTKVCLDLNHGRCFQEMYWF